MRTSDTILFSLPFLFIGYRYVRDNCKVTVIRTEEDRVHHVVKQLFPHVKELSFDNYAKAFFMPDTRGKIFLSGDDDSDEFYKALYREIKKQNPNVTLSYDDAASKRDELHADFLKTVESKVDEIFLK